MSASLPLFVYGTLRDPDVLEVVLGRRVDARDMAPATLAGRSCVRVPDETYPVLVEAPGKATRGDLIAGLDDADLDRIRFFENDEYVLAPCRVDTASARGVEALLCEDSNDCGASEPWTLEGWRRQHKAGFLEDARAYMALHGRMSAAEADAAWERICRREAATEAPRVGSTSPVALAHD